MTMHRQWAARWVAAVAAVALLLGGVHAQPSEPSAAQSEPTFWCGVVHARPDMAGYYSELCRAFHEVLQDDEGHLGISRMASDDLVRAMLDGSVDIAIGLPWEGTGAAPVRHGAMVLVMPFGRFGLAVREGEDRLLERASWLFHALVQAEVLGIGSAAPDQVFEPDAARHMFDRYARRLTDQLGVPEGAIQRMIDRHGHHGVIYGRWFEDPLPANRPVELGGQLYAPPVSDR